MHYVVFFLFFLISYVFSENSPKIISPDIIKKGHFILDKVEIEKKEPRKFRTTQNPLKKDYKDINLTGYKDLNISGSSQFNEEQWIFIKDYLVKTFSLVDSDIYVIDLREEPHFFLNGEPVTMAVDDLKKEDVLKFEAFISVDKDNIQLFEQNLVEDIQKKKDVNIYKVLNKKGKIFHQKYKKQHIQIDSVKTERDITQHSGVHYIRFSVTDHKRPTDKLIDEFLDFLGHLPENSWLHFHCRGGVGRTSSFMLMMDIIKNAKDLTLEDLILRNVGSGGSKKLFDLKNLGISKFKDGLVRRDFLVNFYTFVKDPKGYKTTSWSEWIKRKKQ